MSRLLASRTTIKDIDKAKGKREVVVDPIAPKFSEYLWRFESDGKTLDYETVLVKMLVSMGNAIDNWPITTATKRPLRVIEIALVKNQAASDLAKELYKKIRDLYDKKIKDVLISRTLGKQPAWHGVNANAKDYSQFLLQSGKNPTTIEQICMEHKIQYRNKNNFRADAGGLGIRKFDTNDKWATVLTKLLDHYKDDQLKNVAGIEAFGIGKRHWDGAIEKILYSKLKGLNPDVSLRYSDVVSSSVTNPSRDSVRDILSLVDNEMVDKIVLDDTYLVGGNIKTQHVKTYAVVRSKAYGAICKLIMTADTSGPFDNSMPDWLRNIYRNYEIVQFHAGGRSNSGEFFVSFYRPVSKLNDDKNSMDWMKKWNTFKFLMLTRWYTGSIAKTLRTTTGMLFSGEGWCPLSSDVVNLVPFTGKYYVGHGNAQKIAGQMRDVTSGKIEADIIYFDD